jgi:hypothetical protein
MGSGPGAMMKYESRQLSDATKACASGCGLNEARGSAGASSSRPLATDSRSPTQYGHFHAATSGLSVPCS